MPSFEYTARNLKGDLVKDKIDLATRDDVIAHLRKNRMVVVQVREAKGKGGGLADLFKAGVTRAVVYDVESGHTLADALRKHPKAFTDLYVNMVAAGEAGGILDTILLRLAVFLEKNDSIVRKVKGAMIYPAVIFSVAGIAIAVLLIFVIPTFQSMFASVNLDLPLPTRIVIGASNILKNFWWAIIGLGIFGFVAVKRYYTTSQGKLQIDKLMLSMPVLGDLLRKSAVSRFTRTLGTLISSGVSILDGLEITARTAGNMVIHN